MGERVFYAVNYFIIALLSLTTLYPFVYIIAESFSSTRAITSGQVVLWPVEPGLSNFRNVLEDGQIFHAMQNTVTLTVVGTVLNMAFTVLCAYSLAQKRLAGRNFMLLLITFTMVFNAGMIPNFILVKDLGLMNSNWSLWAPGLISTFNMFVMKSYFESLPVSLSEAAEIDGANDLVILVSVILPISLPMIATITLFYCVGWWNSYFNAMMYLTSSTKMPLMVKLLQMIQQAQIAASGTGDASEQQSLLSPEGYRAASIVIATLPILCVYPFLQKYFVKGVMIGSIKG